MHVPVGEEPTVVSVAARLEEIPFPADGRISIEDATDEISDTVVSEPHLSFFGPDDESVWRNDAQDMLDVLRVDGVVERVEDGPDVPVR